MISCAEATRRLWDYLDRALDTGEREQVEAHLGLCRECCGELEFARVLRDYLASQAARTACRTTCSSAWKASSGS